ncbi:MAG: hypothetical protein KGS61_02070, partial [Verrucomicrobia bacterium]|nr:hypothetical protein [Verrucomicrobiota bacterium]
MSTEGRENGDGVRAASGELGRLRRFAGPPNEFWPAFLAATAGLTGARQVVLLLKSGPTAAEWKKLSQWSADGSPDRYSVAFGQQLASWADRGAKTGGVVETLDGVAGPDARHFALATSLQLPKADDNCVVALLLSGVSAAQAREALLRIQLVADT